MEKENVMLKTRIQTLLLAGLLCSLPLSAWSANLLANGSFNKPAPGVPPGTPVSYTNYCSAGNSAADSWTIFVNSCSTGFDDITTTLVPSTLPGSTGYMLQVTTDGNANGIVQSGTFNQTSTVTSIWLYINSGCVTVGTGNGGNTGPDDTFCETGKWFRMTNVPNGVSPGNEIIVYAESQLENGNGADFYVKNASVVAVP
jgi:hypothetical protein